MKINGENPFVTLEAYVKNIEDKRKVDKPSGRRSEQTGEEDKVVLSPKAKEIQEAEKYLQSVPDIREEKVAELKARIEKGEYKVEGKKIAVKMVKESLLNELL